LWTTSPKAWCWPARASGIVATLTSDPAKASGLDGAVKTLGAAPFGRILLILAALGFAAYGLYSFVKSRYGRM